MIKVSREAKSVLDRLTEGLEERGHHREIDNAPGTFMAVHIEHTGDCSMGPMFSVAHYYEQNGDLMKDPDMVFIRADGEIYPIEFQQDPVICQRAVQWDGRGKISGFNLKLQRDLARFTAKWMHNIRHQQKLKA